MNKFLLWCIMLPSGLWRTMGADVEQLRAILKIRLILDDRKPVSMMRAQKQKKEMKYGSILKAFILLVMGFMYMFPLTIVNDRILSLTYYFTLLLAIIVFMLITDFSSVLFDARDKYILFPRPVSDRTLVLAKMLHVFIYLLLIVLPMSLPGWIVLGIMDGWKSATLFVLPLILLVCITLFVVNGIYLLVLRLVKPEKFKDVINYFQVFTSILFFASVYFIPGFFTEEHTAYFDILKYPWVRFTPPYWLAACWSWIGYPVTLTGTGVYSALAIVVPLACMYLLVRFLSPQFARRISGIDTVEGVHYEPAKTTKRSSGRLYQKLAAVFNRTSDARAGFIIGWLQTSRSRSFRMRVYPSFAFVPIYFVYLLSQRKEPLNEVFHHLAKGKMHLMLMYYSSMVMISAMNYLTISEQYKAAWIYYSTPVETPGRIMIGAFKALLVKFFLPFFTAITVFILYVWGAHAMWDVLLAFTNVTLFVSIIARLNFRYLPFSQMEQMKQNGTRVLKSFVAMLIPVTLGFGHFLAFNLLWLKLIFLVLSSILLWLVWDSYANTSWANMIKSELE